MLLKFLSIQLVDLALNCNTLMKLVSIVVNSEETMNMMCIEFELFDICM